jgi:protein SCO1
MWAKFIVLAVLLAGCAPADKPKFHFTDITGAQFARQLSLPDHSGQTRQLSDFAGKVVMVSFGFTHCPDVCPSTLATWAGVKQQLGDKGRDLQVLFVTVDPERDTPELLRQYVPAFDPSFLGLRGSPEQTAEAAKEFKATYQKASGASPSTYTVDHSTQVYVFDKQGRVRLLIPHNAAVAAIVKDLKLLF